jgi:hypothetical protein
MSSMSSSLHPVLKLADDSIRNINSQLNSSSLHHNSVCIRSGSKSKKKRGIKISNKISYVIAPRGFKIDSNSKMLRTTGDSKRRKLDSTLEKEDFFNQNVELLDQDTGRRSDATTLKEGEGSCIKKIGFNNKTSKRKKSKKNSENYYMISSPPHSQFSGCNKNLLQLIPELSKNSLDRIQNTESNRNLAREFESAEQDLSKSLREDDLDVPNKKHKTSCSSTNEEYKISKFTLSSEQKEKYEDEIKALKQVVSKK